MKDVPHLQAASELQNFLEFPAQLGPEALGPTVGNTVG